MPPTTLHRLQFLAAALALGGALVFQHLMHLPPCHFCLLQRYPYFGVLAVSGAALGWSRRAGEGRLQALAALNLLLFLTSAGLAGWHSGLERGWWTSGSGCTSPVGGDTPEALLNALLTAPIVRCDEIPWDVLGLSIANLNVIYGAGVAALSAWALLRQQKANRP